MRNRFQPVRTLATSATVLVLLAGWTAGEALKARTALTEGSAAALVTDSHVETDRFREGVKLFSDRVYAAPPLPDLRVEVLDRDGHVIEPFSAARCKPISADGTLVPVTWEGSSDLASLPGKPVRLRFTLTNGKLYAFWVSPDVGGASHGYVAAGGPGFTGPIDTVGNGKSALAD
ncbi:MAG: hypothetical protein KJ000_03065 [Pirellulaceae bacterium]|nr:hypothetical protein [Pirellulaceae bacterium]